MQSLKLSTIGMFASLSLALTSCVIDPLAGLPLPPPPPLPGAIAPGPPILALPYGARPTYYRGVRCWYHGGHYYRHNPRGRGYVCF